MITSSINFLSGSEQKVQVLGVVDDTGAFINNADVRATMYDPSGAALLDFSNIVLASIDATGDYQYIVPATFAAPTQFGYTIKITVTVGATLKNTLVSPVIVPCAVDHVSVAAAKDWLNIDQVNTAEDNNIQMCITAASFYWLGATGRSSQDGTLPATSPLVQPVQFSETYDGHSCGKQRMFVRNTPIVSVQSLTIDGVTVPASLSPTGCGYVIDSSRKSIALRGHYFRSGFQNVAIQYTAGYNFCPPDIQLATLQMVAVNYKRRKWIDQKSQSMANGAGTISYRDWELPPEVVTVINGYSRAAMV